MKTSIVPIGDYQGDCGRRLRRLINLLGINYVEAADLMGVSKGVLNNWMAGSHPVQAYPLYRLCRSKNVNFDYVFLGDWSSLPFGVAKPLEDELRSAPEAGEAEAPKGAAVSS